MEKIVFGNAVRSFADDLSSSDIKSAEQDLGIKFPGSLVAFYKEVNGGYFVRNCWKSCSEEIYIVGQILPIKYTLRASKMSLENSYCVLRDKNMLPDSFVPFAMDLGGNYFCVGGKDEKIYWLSHEHSIEDEFDKAVTMISNGIKAFVSELVSEEDVEDYL
ncbi:SMI1/KNR4 family protein [Microbulbifer litoralis]|uniref:SMI1/KNR4 family protein n=1 Tax=Microbulbifer litoralis TaxID=2933965 RepID=UPI002028FEC9|nr:SMI1/KNR4 family protein [Microbulbifer sp. GX H0434]